jgi:hypothetical protein
MAGVAPARIANRHVLHPVYYSTAKKTALPLNKACTRARSDTMGRDRAIKTKLDHSMGNGRRQLVPATEKLKKL